MPDDCEPTEYVITLPPEQVAQVERAAASRSALDAAVNGTDIILEAVAEHLARLGRLSGIVSPGCVMCSPMAAMPGQSCVRRSKGTVTGPSRSSSDQTQPKGLKFSRAGGSLNGPSRGSGGADALPKIGRHQPKAQPPGLSSQASG